MPTIPGLHDEKQDFGQSLLPCLPKFVLMLAKSTNLFSFFHDRCKRRSASPEFKIVNNPEQKLPGDWRQGGYRDAYDPVPKPPRKPTAAAKELIYSYQGAQHALRIIGLILIAISIPFVWGLGDGLPTDLVLSLTNKQAIGKVTGHRVVEHIKIDDRSPLGIAYEYEISGEKYASESYTVDSTKFQSLSVRESIPIEILSIAPSWSRASGTTASKMGVISLGFFLFPLIGLGMILWAARSNAREIRAFRDGKPIKGLVIKRGFDDKTEINGKNPFEIIWEFHVDGLRYTGKLSHMKREELEKAIPSSEVTVLYDIHDPKVNTVWLE